MLDNVHTLQVWQDGTTLTHNGHLKDVSSVGLRLRLTAEHIYSVRIIVVVGGV